MGARLRGVDLIPDLLEHTSVVLSQFGHMFAPRPEVSIAEMLRVLKSGGTIAFATWPPELLVGSSFKLVSGYMSPPPPGVSPRCNEAMSLSCASALAQR